MSVMSRFTQDSDKGLLFFLQVMHADDNTVKLSVNKHNIADLESYNSLEELLKSLTIPTVQINSMIDVIGASNEIVKSARRGSANTILLGKSYVGRDDFKNIFKDDMYPSIAIEYINCDENYMMYAGNETPIDAPIAFSNGKYYKHPDIERYIVKLVF